jgi:hypothetical protein
VRLRDTHNQLITAARPVTAGHAPPQAVGYSTSPDIVTYARLMTLVPDENIIVDPVSNHTVDTHPLWGPPGYTVQY